MTLLDNCKKELAVLRDNLDKLVKCLQDASQADNIADFQGGIGCADDMSIVLCADLFVLRQLAFGGEEIKEAPKVEVVEVKTEVEATPMVDLVKEEIKEIKVEPVKEEIKDATL